MGRRPKALVTLAGRTALEHVTTTCRAAGVEPVAILGAHLEAVAEECRRLNVGAHPNQAWSAGQTGTLQAGWRAIGAETIAYWPVDIPLANAVTLRAILHALAGTSLRGPAPRESRIPSIPVPTFQGRRGHPIILPLGVRDEVLALSPDSPLFGVVRRYAREVPVEDPGIHIDINTPDDLATAEAYARERAAAAEAA
jgi:molybdenum cofactor cytidylyltransferase